VPHVVCLVDVEPDRAVFAWSEGPAAFKPFALDRMVYKDFVDIIAAARKKLADLVADSLYNPDNLPIAAYELAAAGFELYEAMFDPGAEDARQARQVRTWLERLTAEGSIESLEIVVESPWALPWNVIYDQEPDQEAFLASDRRPDCWRPFWGVRHNLAGGRRVDPLRRMPILKEPCVVVVVDADIRDGLPEEQRQRLAGFAQRRSLALVHTRGDLEKAIKTRRPDVLYWMSHATPDALILGADSITPRDMRKLLRPEGEEQFGGLAFLNGCRTAEAGAAGSFFEAFHSVGFAGMIGTENQTVDVFANPFGLDFLEAFLERGEPVGDILHRLRGRVPLGLLYGTYCPPNIRVERGQPCGAPEVHEERITGRALGVGGAAGAPGRAWPPLPEEPYPSLRHYDRGDRALFAGRDDDVRRFAAVLDDPATRILVLHGESGVGKSSFLQAGVIPFLEEECLGYRFIRERPSDGSGESQGSVIHLRATNDLFGQLAKALCDACARRYAYRTPTGEPISTDLPGALRAQVGGCVDQGSVRLALIADPGLLGRILGAIGDLLPFTAVLVVDQGEEVFTLARSPEDQERGRLALEMLRRVVEAPAGFKVIFSLRTEYFGRLIDRLRQGWREAGGIRDYLLTDFDEEALIDAIRRPTAAAPIPYASEIPAERYGFRYAEGVAEVIAHRVIRHNIRRRDSVLPLVQVICTQLYRNVRRRDDRVIAAPDLEAIGGVEGGLRLHVEQQLDRIVGPLPSEQRAFKELVARLYLRQPDGSLTTALLVQDDLAAQWRGRSPFDRMLAAAAGLRVLRISSLRIGGVEERSYVSLGHDALAKLAAQWDEELTRSARLRRRLWRTAAWASAAAGILLFVGAVVLSMKMANDRKVARNEVESTLQARANALPYAIKVLVPQRGYAVEYLAARYRDHSLPAAQRLHAACALAQLEQADPEVTGFLVGAIPATDADESPNVIAALREDRDRAAGSLRDRFGREVDPAARVRWAVALLSLGDPEPARAMLRAGEDPGPRSRFIEDFRLWPGDPSILPGLLDLDTDGDADPDFRSGLCAALGKLPKEALDADDIAALSDALRRLHGRARDGGSHSTSGGTLRAWKIAAPEAGPSSGCPEGFGWYINSLGMSMIRIAGPGSFRMGSDKGEINERPLREVAVRPFFLCDREVSVGQYEAFMKDPDCPATDRPRGWSGPDRSVSPLPACPVQKVAWEGAILFCNWLSRKEGLRPCYIRDGGRAAWELHPEADGYRLPTEAEWEYACRAGSTTEYLCGDTPQLLPGYAVFNNVGVRTEPCGSRLPNAWGLFDMVGNVWELCEDVYDPAHRSSIATAQAARVVRGASIFDSLQDGRSARRDMSPDVDFSMSNGFRVARGCR
jgi:formylglycine-generating enzyme required for sulfatase activity